MEPTSHAVRTRRLVKRFGATLAVDAVDSEVPRGLVTALVGPNGAGKTTLLRILLGLWRATSGNAEVLGLDPLRDRVALRRRCGFVPDHLGLPSDARVSDVLALVAATHPGWDSAFADELVHLFALPVDRKVKALSRGARAQLAFALAAAPRPELLVLDEPTSGLDPLVRRSFLEAVRTLVAGGARTVLFSTHVMADVDRVADRVVLMGGGRVLVDDDVARLRERFAKVSLLFAEPPSRELAVPDALRVDRGLREVVALYRRDDMPDAAEIARRLGASDARVLVPDFEEVFVELLARRRSDA